MRRWAEKGKVSSVTSPIMCLCGSVIPVRTSWTNDNPVRRFASYEIPKGAGNCGFFEWMDPPTCERGKPVIPGLLRMIRKIEAREGLHKKKMKWLCAATCFSWLVVVLVIWFK